jgi:hypothetical protein
MFNAKMLPLGLNLLSFHPPKILYMQCQSKGRQQYRFTQSIVYDSNNCLYYESKSCLLRFINSVHKYDS